MVRTFLKVYMELGSYFLFLQEQIKDIIIIISRSYYISLGDIFSSGYFLPFFICDLRPRYIRTHSLCALAIMIILFFLGAHPERLLGSVQGISFLLSSLVFICGGYITHNFSPLPGHSFGCILHL